MVADSNHVLNSVVWLVVVVIDVWRVVIVVWNLVISSANLAILLSKYYFLSVRIVEFPCILLLRVWILCSFSLMVMVNWVTVSIHLFHLSVHESIVLLRAVTFLVHPSALAVRWVTAAFLVVTWVLHVVTSFVFFLIVVVYSERVLWQAVFWPLRLLISFSNYMIILPLLVNFSVSFVIETIASS